MECVQAHIYYFTTRSICIWPCTWTCMHVIQMGSLGIWLNSMQYTSLWGLFFLNMSQYTLLFIWIQILNIIIPVWLGYFVSHINLFAGYRRDVMFLLSAFTVSMYLANIYCIWVPTTVLVMLHKFMHTVQIGHMCVT